MIDIEEQKIDIAKYHEFLQGKMSVDDWHKHCMDRLNELMEKHKDVLIRLKDK